MPKVAESSPTLHTPALSRNNQIVFDALSTATRPLSAYDLLDQVRPQGLRAPPQVYRALHWLTDHGLVHKIESANAFVVCAHASCCGGEKCNVGAKIFFLCDECGDAVEADAGALADYVTAQSQQSGFSVRDSSLEVHGTCSACRVDVEGQPSF